MEYSIDDVRDIAERASYEEIDFNSSSRVMSFRRDTTRINVYYSTGTVGTCLNHPVKGKTQLFRRNVGIHDLERIFFQPRTHTGKGYYRKHVSQKWKAICADTGQTFFECDAARRWRYVAHASGLTHNQSEIRSIVNWLEYWNSICWNPDQGPRLEDMNFACGPTCAFTNMILGVLREVLYQPVIGCNVSGEGDMNDERNIQYEGDFRCTNVSSFLEEHKSDVSELRRQVRTFRKDIKIELLSWLFSLFHCGCALFTLNDAKLVETKYSNAVHSARGDYGDLMYPKKSELCRIHGVC